MRSTKSVLLALALCVAASPALAWTHGVSPQIFSVGTCGNADDSAKINAALDLAISAYTGGARQVGIYVPAGQCALVTPHATMTVPVSIFGDGSSLSIINLASSLSGPAFAWSDVYANNIFVADPPVWANYRGGVQVAGIGIKASDSAAAQQDAFVFYNRTDELYVNDIACWYVSGRCFSAGRENAVAAGWMRESKLYNVWAWHCGRTGGVPSVELYSDGAGDSTNTNLIVGMDIIASNGPGLLLANNNTVKGLTYTDFIRLRVEASATDDLIDIGDGTSSGGVDDVFFDGAVLIGPPAGKYAVKIQAKDATAAAKFYEIVMDNTSIGPGSGGGIDVLAGRGMSFTMRELSVSQTSVTVGAAALGIAAPITFSGTGNTTSWTTSIDGTSSGFLFKQTLGSFP